MDGMLYKYTQAGSKINAVLRYCQINSDKFKYFKNKLQGTEWLARPICEYTIKSIEQANYVVIESKKAKKSLSGFEIALLAKPNKLDSNKIYFGCENEEECYKWIMLIRYLIEQTLQ
jgi:hypothetical protein